MHDENEGGIDAQFIDLADQRLFDRLIGLLMAERASGRDVDQVAATAVKAAAAFKLFALTSEWTHGLSDADFRLALREYAGRLSPE